MGGRPCLFPHLYDLGIEQLQDIYHPDENRWLTVLEIQDQFGMGFNWLQYESLLASLPKMWLTLANRQCNSIGDEKLCLHELTEVKHLPSKIYRHCVDLNANSHLRPYLHRLLKNIPELNTESETFLMQDFYELFGNIYTYTYSVKLRDFQYRLLLNKLPTNAILHKWGIKTSERCDFCNETQTLRHLLWECQYVQNMWAELRSYLEEKELDISLNFQTVITNKTHPVKTHVSNFIVLICKQCIY